MEVVHLKCLFFWHSCLFIDNKSNYQSTVVIRGGSCQGAQALIAVGLGRGDRRVEVIEAEVRRRHGVHILYFSNYHKIMRFGAWSGSYCKFHVTHWKSYAGEEH